ncbi:putative cercosporin toxin biosynthesis protein [Diaporthe ampelina]|uniref:Putative cercosporin toxin biosynthesis protein n=1 Tax=Diaporthe ampelina TaxID=1214573 RepID=A0A0G2HJ68_9PEZI|nr:putative cercosporin toxin biosynthesis protein [Diaporthe ampelina]
MAPQAKVLIIGGGLSGLALAQGLKAAQVPFHVFERDTSAAFRAQGYRLRINDDAIAALRQLLPAPLFGALEQVGAETAPGGHRLDAATGEERGWPGGGPPPQHGRAHNADRAVLRRLLLRGLEGDVSFGRCLVGYALRAGGAVEARFADGTGEVGTVLVGADGVRSAVRKQFLPGLTILDSEGRAVFGKTEITPHLLSKVAPQLADGICFSSADGQPLVSLFSDTMRWDRERSAIPGIGIPNDYIYWVLCFRLDALQDVNSSPGGLVSLPPAESAQLSLHLTRSWHERLRVVFEAQEADETASLPFYLVKQDSFISEWENAHANNSEPVTLLGDAAHPIPPVAGLGASFAFQEAIDLYHALVRISDGQHSIPEELAAYGEKMRQRMGSLLDKIMGPAARFFSMRPVQELGSVSI